MFRKVYTLATVPDPTPPQSRGSFRKAIDPHSQDDDGLTPIQCCLANNHDDAIFMERAIRAGCDVNAPDKQGVAPLVVAAFKGYAKCIRVLLQGGACGDLVSRCDRTALMVACQLGHVTCVEALIGGGVNVNVTNGTDEIALHYAAAAGNSECVRPLLKAKAKVNYPDRQGYTPLIHACKIGNPEVVDLLLAAGARPDKCDVIGRAPIHWVAALGNVGCARSILRSGRNTCMDKFDKFKCNPFALSISGNNAGVLKELLDAGVERYTVDGLSGTALALASLKGHKESTQLLLDAGENPDDVGFFSMTPLMSAAFESHVELVRMLLRYHANPNITSNMTSVSALLMATIKIPKDHEQDRHAIIADLIRNGADVNYRIAKAGFFTAITNGKNCPLSFAITSGYSSLVRMLLLGGSVVSMSEVIDWIQKDIPDKQYDRHQILEPVLEWQSHAQPLTHLCRRVVRAALRDRFPARIQALPIAPKLKDYINFSDLDQIPVSSLAVPESSIPMLSDFVTFSPCGLGALEGTHLYNHVKVKFASWNGDCDCDICKRLAAQDG